MNRQQAQSKKTRNPKWMPHQRDAVLATCNTLLGINVDMEYDRTKVIMPCGTGKTRVQLWTAEMLGADVVLVLEPSLALIRQNLKEWLTHTRWPRVNILAVCSDPTVSTGLEEDEIIFAKTDLDFPVTSDPTEIHDFLSSDKPGVKLVFSTYHSANLVAEGMPRNFLFPAAIFDEAHKTAGREDGMFSFALSDDNIPILKRVFYTATPRHYDVPRIERWHKDRELEMPIVYSMDHKDVYGPTAYQLSFRDAVKRGIICDYEVIVSVVTSKMLGKQLLEDGTVEINGEFVPAKNVAHCLAIAQAVRKYGIRKVFTFHPRVRDAQEFTNGSPYSVIPHLPRDFCVTHVNGYMSTAAREDEMNLFRHAEQGLVSNARCLTEGVDVPAVDMVAFLSKKRELIDIVQATGRAMRRAPGKDKGYILVPLYVEQEEGESIEAAVERANFREVWAVLNAMREQDEALAATVSRLRQKRGEDPDDDDGPIDIDDDHVSVVGPKVDIRLLRRSITAMVIDRLGSNWDEMFGRLVRFKEEHGHCNVPGEWSSDPQLGSWVANQRQNYRANKILPDRVARLVAIGFVWSELDTRWEDMFAELVAFKKKHGHCNVSTLDKSNYQLGVWVANQRQNYRANKILPDRVARLVAIGFVWSKLDTRWEDMFAKLVAFKKKHGHCNVPYQWKQNPQLAVWVFSQRDRHKKRKLRSDRVKRLTAIGFVWNKYDTQWEDMFAKLVAFKKKHGHCNVPANSKTEKSLGTWVAQQRKNYRAKKLSPARSRRLKLLGFVWDVLATARNRWEDMFAKLVAFKKKHGHCNVPDRWKSDRSLASWVANQRQNYRTKVLSKDRVKRLESIGFAWKRYTRTDHK